MLTMVWRGVEVMGSSVPLPRSKLEEESRLEMSSRREEESDRAEPERLGSFCSCFTLSSFFSIFCLF